jgi:hypothetical protein
MIQFFKDLLFKDLPLKLVSLALAVALWATVATLIEKGERERGVTMSSNKQFQGVPVAVVSAFGDATGYRVEPAEVTVFIQGTPEAITELEPASVRALVDLSYWDSRENLPLPVRIIVPPGTAVVSKSPEEVRIIPPEPHPAPAIES